MNKHFKKVQSVLKTRVSSLGFNKKELESVAEAISNNLNLDDEATEEEVNDAIENAVGSAIPFLKVSQSVSNRVIQAYKDSRKDDDDDDDDEDPVDEPPTSKKKNRQKGNEGESEMAKMFKALTDEIGSLKGEIATFKESKTKDTRLDKLKEIVKGTGSYEKSVLRTFSRTTFKDDEDFDSYLEEVKEGLEDYNNERVSVGLDELTPPSKGGNKKKNEEDETMSDDDIDSLADSMN